MPREGHDGAKKYAYIGDDEFQSTCPARGTTINADPDGVFYIFQSTCPARGTTMMPSCCKPDAR